MQISRLEPLLHIPETISATSTPLRLIQYFFGALEHGFEHRGCQSSGLGVVAAAVVGIDQYTAVEQVFCGMAEFISRLFQTKAHDDGFVCDAAQCNDDVIIRQSFQLFAQPVVTGIDFRCDGFVLWRQALDRIGDAAVDQLEIIVCRGGFRFCGKAVFMQGLV